MHSFGGSVHAVASLKHAIIDLRLGVRHRASFTYAETLAGMSQHGTEVATGQRFEFGKNWAWFLENLNEKQIDEAVQSLRAMLETDSLAGKKLPRHRLRQ